LGSFKRRFDWNGIKREDQRTYDKLSPYYQSIWGAHIHHGYWITGTETKEEAQIQLLEELAKRAALDQIGSGLKVLDVGCGIGGGSAFLSTRFKAQVLGITLSSTQVEMASKMIKETGVKGVEFRQMDAEQLQVDNGESFDCVWIVEAMSHFGKKEEFIRRANKFLRLEERLQLQIGSKENI